MSQTCCTTHACSWFQDNFSFEIKNTEKGINLSLSPKDEAKSQALQNLLASAKAFCQAFCKDSD